MRVNDTITIGLDGGGRIGVTLDEYVPGIDRGYWAYDRQQRCYWIDSVDGHAYHAEGAARIKGHCGKISKSLCEAVW